MRVAFATLGCRLNQSDTSEVQALLEAEGFRTVPFETPAEVYVINTCTVTARADYSDRQTIRRAIARNPDAVVVVTGCYAQTNPQAVAGIPGVDLVLGTQDRHALPGLLHQARKRVRPLVRVSDVSEARTLPAIPVRGAMLTEFQTLSPSQDLGAAVDLLLHGSQQDFPVTDGGRLVGMLPRSALIKALATAGRQGLVSAHMQRGCGVASPDEPLEPVLARLQGESCRTLPVLADGALVGLLTLENVGELLMVISATASAPGARAPARYHSDT